MLICDSNLKAKAATGQHTGMDVDSMVKFNGEYWSAGPTGLFKMDGADVNVEAYIVTATMDFGISNDKRLRYVYLSLESTGNLSLSINTEKVTAMSFPVTITGTGQQDIRVPVSRALYGRFWTFRLSGTCDFSLDEIKVLPIIRGAFH